MMLDPSGQLTLLAPPFLAELLDVTSVAQTRLRVLPWESGTLPVDPRDIDIIVPWVADVPATRSVISRLRPTSWVCSVHAGVDWFIESVPPDVLVTGGRGLRSEACAEWVVAVTLALLRGLPDFYDDQRARTWHPRCFGTLDGATVLLVGYGSIGAAIEAVLLPFGAQIRRVAEHRRPGVGTMADLPDLVGTADVVVLAVPLVPSTERLVDAAFLRRMPRGSLLVNVGRGQLVDSPALGAALRAGHIRAALDVVDPEPLPPGHELYDAPGLLLTPHISGLTEHFGGRARHFLLDQVVRHLRGESVRNVVSRDLIGVRLGPRLASYELRAGRGGDFAGPGAEPFDGAIQAILGADGGPPAQPLAGPDDDRAAANGVIGGQRAVLGAGAGPGDPDHQRGDLRDGEFLGVAEVHRAGLG
jgi:phosphoglycerate dehydrogenase-like enzyme